MKEDKAVEGTSPLVRITLPVNAIVLETNRRCEYQSDRRKELDSLHVDQVVGTATSASESRKEKRRGMGLTE